MTFGILKMAVLSRGLKSNIETENHSKVGYSVISHHFEKPVDYLLKVNRTIKGVSSTAHLFVKVEE